MIKIEILYKNKDNFARIIKLSSITKFEMIKNDEIIRIEICINGDTYIYTFNCDEICGYRIERIN